MKKIKTFVALGLLFCGLVHYSSPVLAQDAECVHP